MTNQQLLKIRRDIQSLEPARTPGMLTSKTTAGVMRQPKPDSGTGTGNQVARWA
jgi:hypothetical protein